MSDYMIRGTLTVPDPGLSREEVESWLAKKLQSVWVRVESMTFTDIALADFTTSYSRPIDRSMRVEFKAAGEWSEKEEVREVH